MLVTFAKFSKFLPAKSSVGLDGVEAALTSPWRKSRSVTRTGPTPRRRTRQKDMSRQEKPASKRTNWICSCRFQHWKCAPKWTRHLISHTVAAFLIGTDCRKASPFASRDIFHVWLADVDFNKSVLAWAEISWNAHCRIDERGNLGKSTGL